MMPHEKPDLIVSDLIAQKPTRKLIIDVSDLHPGSLTLLEALDIVDASGIDSNNFVTIMSRGRMRDKARLLYAMAWVIARRFEPDLTFEEVCTYQLELKGKQRNDKREQERAEAVIGVASLAGVSPEEAKQMSIAEVAAVTDLHKRRVVKRAPRPHRRRAG
jgi:hypothetical protein